MRSVLPTTTHPLPTLFALRHDQQHISTHRRSRRSTRLSSPRRDAHRRRHHNRTRTRGFTCPSSLPSPRSAQRDPRHDHRAFKLGWETRLLPRPTICVVSGLHEMEGRQRELVLLRTRPLDRRTSPTSSIAICLSAFPPWLRRLVVLILLLEHLTIVDRPTPSAGHDLTTHSFVRHPRAPLTEDELERHRASHQLVIPNRSSVTVPRRAKTARDHLRRRTRHFRPGAPRAQPVPSLLFGSLNHLAVCRTWTSA